MESVKEVLGIRFVDVFDTKIINNQHEGKVVQSMFPQAQGDWHWSEPMWGKEFGEAVIGNVAGLGEPIHAFADFNVDVLVVDERGEIILLHDGDGDDGDWYLHVFVFIHGSVEVKVFDVAGHEFCVGCGKDTVEHDFNCCEVCHLGADIAIVSNMVATHSELHMGCFFLGDRQ